MALKLSHTSPDGVTHADCYWRVVSFAADDSSKSARAVFYGYHDAAARSAGKAPVGVKAYDVSGADYDTQGFLTCNDVKAKAYAYAKAKLDVGEGEDAKSFFHGAADV